MIVEYIALRVIRVQLLYNKMLIFLLCFSLLHSDESQCWRWQFSLGAVLKDDTGSIQAQITSLATKVRSSW